MTTTPLVLMAAHVAALWNLAGSVKLGRMVSACVFWGSVAMVLWTTMRLVMMGMHAPGSVASVR